MEGLKIIIAADATQGINAVAKFNAELGKVGASGAKVGVAITKVNTSLNSVKSSSNTAGQALQNLGRVVQDAPYGFIGISNNINPLLESFQRLRAESGSTKVALKSLVAGLAGGAGIGLAISVATGLLTVFGDKLFNTGTQAKKAKDELKELLVSIVDIRTEAIGSVEGEIVKVNALTKAILDESRSREERNRAIGQLKQINKEYFGDLTLEGEKLEKLKGQVEEYTKAIIAQAVVKGFEGEIGKVAVELSKQEQAFIKASAAVTRFEQKMDKVAKMPVAGAGANPLASLTIGLNTANDKLKTQSESLLTVKAQYNDLRKAIQGAVEETLKFKPLSVPAPEKLKAIREIELPVREIKLDPAKITLQPTDLASIDGLGPLSDKINAQLKIMETTGIEFPLAASFDNAFEKAEKLATYMATTLQPVFSAVFETIASGGTNALQAFGQALKALVAKLVSAAITAAVFAAIMTVASGGASQVFQGRFLDMFSVLSGLPKFAEGGIVQGPMNAIIGEKGPEAVIPLRDLNRVLGSIGGGFANNINVVVHGILRGPDIYLSGQKAKNQLGGTFT